jgi:hypothetical protein
MQTIPFTSDPWASFTTFLGGVEYRFAQYFNERNARWSFDLSLERTGEMLAAGIPILIGCDLLAPYALGIGTLLAVDLSAAAAVEAAGILPQSVDAGPEDLGARVIVVFIAPGEVIE